MLPHGKVEELEKILINYFFVKRFRSDATLEKRIKEGNMDAMAEGLTKHRLKFEYLI